LCNFGGQFWISVAPFSGGSGGGVVVSSGGGVFGLTTQWVFSDGCGVSARI
jgi:hypothetical protein